MEKRRVVITGMGTVNPIGNTVAESWEALKAGKCGIGPITRYDTSNQKVKLAGEVKGLDVDGLLGKRDAKKMDRFTQFALIAADQAMADSGLDREKENLDRCGVLISSGIGGFETVGEAHTRGMNKGFDSVSPFMIPMIISNMAAGHAAIRYGFRGMCSCVVTACAGGTKVMPGVLIIEALAQVGAVAILTVPENKGKLALFGGIKNARFKQQVRPGDVLELECELTAQRGPVGFGTATAKVNGKTACKAELTFALTESAASSC